MLRVNHRELAGKRFGLHFGALILLTGILLLSYGLQVVNGLEGQPNWFASSEALQPQTVGSASWDELNYQRLGCKRETIVAQSDNTSTYAPVEGCVFHGDNVRLATYVSGSSYHHVSIGTDSKFYRIWNARVNNVTLKLLPGSQKFFTITPATDASIGDYISVFDNIVDRLQFQPFFPFPGSYNLDTTNPLVFPGTDNSVLYVKGYGFSPSSKFLAYGRDHSSSSAGDRITKVNLETGEHEIVGIGYKAVWWSQGRPEYGVSDSGKYVVSNSYIWNTQNCGVDIAQDTDPMSDPCTEKRYYSCAESTDCLRRHVQFEDEYKFSVIDGTNNLKTVTYVADNYTAGHMLDYLAMGDSISSGEGDIEVNPADGKKYYRPFTDNNGSNIPDIPREKCHSSSRAYPVYLARAMSLKDSPRQWSNIACSGASTNDVYSTAYSLYSGQSQGGPITGTENNTPRLEGRSDRETLQATALNEMIPGRVQQIEFVKKYKPRIVTLTIGANDIDFGDKLTDCLFGPGVCGWATDKKPVLAGQIQDQYDTLRRLYRELYEASGNQAKIYVLGYPQFISKLEPAPCGNNIVFLSKEEREMIYDATAYLNLVIERAANAAGVKYVDVSDALEGGRLCDEGQAYVNGLAFMGSNELQESFHPNHYGHMSIAWKTRQQLDNKTLHDYDICAGGALNCPQTGVAAEKPAIPSNLGGAPAKVSKNVKATSMTIIKNLVQPVRLNKFTFRPGSSVQVELHSNPISLGQFTADTTGKIDEEITVPSSAPAGYHTLVISGETYSGEPIELMQTVLVVGTDPSDLDENSIPDDQQPCGVFMQSSGLDANLNGIDDACDPYAGQEAQLYRLRQGDSGRTYEGNPENEEYLYVERNTRASGITGITDDYDPDGDGWAIVGASQGVPYTTSTAPDIAPAANFAVVGEGMSARPYVYIRAGGYGCTSFTPISLAKVEQGQVRTLEKVAYNIDKCRQELPSADVDANGLPDDDQPLYAARNGDISKSEDPSRIYLFRSFHAAEAQLGVSDYTPTGTPAGDPSQPIQEWNLLASSKPNEYIPAFNKLIIREDSNGKPLPIILTKKQNGQCIAYQPADTTIIKMTTQTTRYLIKLASVPEGESCE